MHHEITDYIRDTKAHLRALTDQKANFSRIRSDICREVENVREAAEQGKRVIPELDYSAIAAGRVTDAQRAEIKRRGCAVVRGVFPQTQVTEWNDEIGAYLSTNDYLTKAKAKAGLDKYFSQLDDATPQIYGVYWSRPQVMARQAESMATTKRFLNRLWDVAGPMGDEFDPDHDYAYADRTRRREPGDTTLGLSPHMDSGSYERWVDPAYQRIYGDIFSGNHTRYDPWKATFRTQTREYASPAVCSMFRTFQGWTGLTTQGPEDGTLSLVPIANSIAYLLTRALQDDIAPEDLCGATPGRALGAQPAYHQDLLNASVPIPVVEPGDTVWWHPDVIHSVANEHHGKDYANVIYIGASPKCPKNEAYARRQAQAFLQGRSAPDFAAEDYEVDFTGRATLDDLTDLGRAQMAL